MGWKEIWRTKSKTGHEAYLKVFENEQGRVTNGEFFILKHGAERDTETSIELDRLQLEALRQTLGKIGLVW